MKGLHAQLEASSPQKTTPNSGHFDFPRSELRTGSAESQTD
jgi:hypothetical protein